MQLKKNQDKDELIDYFLDTHDGQKTRSSMPASVAEEIVKRAETLRLCDTKSFELVVDEKLMFPIDIFYVDENEMAELNPVDSPNKKQSHKE